MPVIRQILPILCLEAFQKHNGNQRVQVRLKYAHFCGQKEQHCCFKMIVTKPEQHCLLEN